MTTRLGVLIFVLTAATVLPILELVRRRLLREKYALLWLAVGVLGLLAGVARPVLDRIADALGVQYGPSMLFLVTTLFLMLVSAHLSWEVSRLEERTRRLAEEIALMRVQPPAVGPEPGGQ